MEAYTLPSVLQGQIVRLEPLNIKHADDLFRASQDERIWQWYTRPAFVDSDDVQNWIQLASHMQMLAEQMPYAIINKKNQLPIGSTRFLNINQSNKSLDIGDTWLAPKYWQTNVNLECKFLMLSHAFDDLNAYRVQLTTDARNIGAQKSIEKLGATKEGILRSERINYDGFRRDSVYYSILDHEWPAIKANLKQLLST